MKLLMPVYVFGASAMLVACGGGEVGGTISGLTADGLTLSNGTETIVVVSGSTSFSFPTLVDDGKTYSVVVVTQPGGLQCTVTNGSGTASANVDVSDVAINCVPVWPLSGTVNGLQQAGLVLSNGTQSINVAPLASSFAFPGLLVQGASYAVTVTRQPLPQSCGVTNGTGTVDAAPVANVAITCK